MSVLNCPRCNVALFAGDAGGAVLHGCGGCGGIFLDAPTAMRITQHITSNVSKLLTMASEHATVSPELAGEAPCPTCARPMTRTHIAAASVDVDSCGPHGVWYDKDELARIARAMAAQGMGNPYAPTRAPAQSPSPVVYPPSQSSSSVVSEVAEDALEIAGNVAVDLAAEGAVEGIFAIISTVFDIITD